MNKAGELLGELDEGGKLNSIQWEDGNKKVVLRLIDSAKGALSLARNEGNDTVVKALEADIKLLKSIVVKLSDF